MEKNKNCLTYWYPKLVKAELPTPCTEIVMAPDALDLLLDAKKPDGFDRFISWLEDAAKKVGLPCFLRTGQGSGKHQWKDTCYITGLDQLPGHVGALVEWSACVDMIGLPTDVWAVREFLPTTPLAVLPNYGDMPLVREFRAFVRDGAVSCLHPYWPLDAIKKGLLPDDRLVEGHVPMTRRDRESALLHANASKLSTDDQQDVMDVAARVALAFNGDGDGDSEGCGWSVDILDTKNGWYVTDMAVASRSFHEPSCPRSKK